MHPSAVACLRSTRARGTQEAKCQVRTGGIRRVPRASAVPAYPEASTLAPPSSNWERWPWLTVRKRQTPPWRQHRAIWPQFALPRTKPASVCSARAERLASARGLGPGPTAALPPPGALCLHLAARATAVGRAGTRAWHLRTLAA